MSKLVVSNAMSDEPDLADRTISHPVRSGGRHLRQIVTKKVPPKSVTCHLSRNILSVMHTIRLINNWEASDVFACWFGSLFMHSSTSTVKRL